MAAVYAESDEGEGTMGHTGFVVIYVVVMGSLIVLCDVLFLRHHFWWRLAVNIGIVVVFAAGYLLFFRDAFMS